MSSAASHPRTRLNPIRWLLGLGKRLYALVLVVLVVWLSALALRYLLVSLLWPAPAPAQITDLPLRPDARTLDLATTAFAGTRAVENPRAPLAHYHQVGAWFQPDPHNDCTRSGCHVALPHSANRASRAFLNLHATSLHCGVCHLTTSERPLPLTWYRLDTGRASGPPALLDAYAWVISPVGQQALDAPTAAIQEQLVRLLRSAAAEASDDPALVRLANSVAGPRYTSEAFHAAVEQVRQELPRHFRGEYGTKLALRDPASRQPRLGHTATEDAVQQWLREGAKLADPQRRDLLDRVHPQRRTPTLHCTDCHQSANSLVDLEPVGYPPARVNTLRTGFVFGAIERISEGEPLHLPTFVTPPPPTTPASAPAAPESQERP